MNEATSNALCNLEQVLAQRGGMTVVEEDYDNAKMDDAKSYCKSIEKDHEELCINIIFTVFSGFHAKKFHANNAIKEK